MQKPNRTLLRITQISGLENVQFKYNDSGPFHSPSSVTTGNANTSYSYTASGTRSEKTTGNRIVNYRSDHDNMITQINAGGSATSFDYNADGIRVIKRSGNSENLYFDNDLEIIDGEPVLYAFAGNLRVAKLTSSSTSYYHKDHLGSTIVMSDSAGNVTISGEYWPYGMDRGTVSLTGPLQIYRPGKGLQHRIVQL